MEGGTRTAQERAHGSLRTGLLVVVLVYYIKKRALSLGIDIIRGKVAFRANFA